MIRLRHPSRNKTGVMSLPLKCMEREGLISSAKAVGKREVLGRKVERDFYSGSPTNHLQGIEQLYLNVFGEPSLRNAVTTGIAIGALDLMATAGQRGRAQIQHMLEHSKNPDIRQTLLESLDESARALDGASRALCLQGQHL